MNYVLKCLSIVLIISACNNTDELKQVNPLILFESFEAFEAGTFSLIDMSYGSWEVTEGIARIRDDKSKEGKKCLQLEGGEITELLFTPDKPIKNALYLFFNSERWIARAPFTFKIFVFNGIDWSEIYDGELETLEAGFRTYAKVELDSSRIIHQVRFECSSPEGTGIFIDNFEIISSAIMRLGKISAISETIPILKGREDCKLLKIEVKAEGMSLPKSITELVCELDGTIERSQITSLSLLYDGDEGEELIFGETLDGTAPVVFLDKLALKHGINNFYLAVTVDESASLNSTISARCLSLTIDNKKYDVHSQVGGKDKRIGIALCSHLDDNVHTYRIPGLATTNNGTLIAVYDILRNSSVDLQGDIDIGMNRSTDGGETWEPMKVIMDMGEWGGLPDHQNGIGDPAVLVDKTNNTIWVAAVWAHGHPGKRNWTHSRPGLEPGNTSQFVLVKSEDYGLSWSEPINITKQIKDPDWYLLLQGPGKGISMENGTIVFPAQYKDKEEMPHSTIIWSDDNGENWHIGVGAKANTTEAQVVELNDGSLMLNMRDNTNRGNAGDDNGRSIATTTDMGMTWTEHPTSKNALIESTFMASLHRHENLLLFSNPNTKTGRHDMTVKISTDDGNSWPQNNWLLLDEGSGRGYSCITSIDNETIGILYEGSQADLVFEKLE